MSELFDVIVVGGGAAGLMCTANINKGLNVAILEKTKNVGTKLLLSGSGQCNLTHSGDVDSFLCHYGDNGRFLKKALYAFSNAEVIEYFEENGVSLFEREDGKIFPKSLKSADIQNVLKREIVQKGHKIISECRLNSCLFAEEKNQYKLQTEKGEFFTSKLVIATGGASYPRTGSSGDGYGFARFFGHKIIKPKQALVPIRVTDWPFMDVSGNTFENAILNYKDGTRKIQRSGSLLITHTGLSGPLVLDFSRYFNDFDTVFINFCGDYNNESVFEKITELLRENPSSKVGNILFKIGIPLNFSHVILKVAKLDKDIPCAEVSKKHIRTVSELICCYRAEIIKESFDVAMATSGGVDLLEVNSITMESKIQKGLYFCGEVLNIDGDTGGYNIQAAFSTGICVAKAVNSYLKTHDSTQ